MEKKFQALGLSEEIQQIVDELYFKKPTQIQEEAIPAILHGKSIIGQSQTGSGKTHAFLLPLLNRLEDDAEGVQIVITAPTRELAMQLHEEIKTMTTIANKENVWTSRLLIGGLDRQRMMKQLERTPKIIVGTPGRILDMVNEGVLSIYSATSFVVDEADLMLDLRFIETIDQLLVKSNQIDKIYVYTATIPITIHHYNIIYIFNSINIYIT